VSLRAVKAKRLIILGVLTAPVVGYIISMIPNFRARADEKEIVSALQSLPRARFIAAVQLFAHEHNADSSVFPGSVVLSELLSGGYLRTQEVAGLERRDASISLPIDETRPQELRIRVRANDGSVIALVGDGSIQKLPRR
jgi:hypothetical protein